MIESFKDRVFKKIVQPIKDYNKKREKKTLKNENDPGEYDNEGSMAKNQLTSIINNSKEIKEMLSDNDNLPEWVQNKITKAEDYISTCKDYLKSEKAQKSENIKESFSDFIKKN